MIDENI